MAKERAVRVSISMPKSMAEAVEKQLDLEYPPRTFSRLVQELIAEDLREAGMLPPSEINGAPKEELVDA